MLPAWPKPMGCVSQALAAKHLVRTQVAVAAIGRMIPMIKCGEWRRRSVVTSAPGLNLLFPVLLLRSLLGQTLQVSVVPLIQFPTTMYLAATSGLFCLKRSRESEWLSLGQK